jgi:hypothetical protein
LACDFDFHVNRRVLLHAANLRHGTDGFTSAPKEGMLWIFSPKESYGFGRGVFFLPYLTVLIALTFSFVRVTNMGQIILLPLPKEGML